MSIWAEIKHAINGSLGKGHFIPLDELSSISMYELKKDLLENEAILMEKQLSKFLIIPWGKAEIDAEEFLETQYKKVIIPDTVQSIGDSAFESASSLEYVYIPRGVRQIERQAFEYCTSLKNVVLPKGLYTVLDRAFSGCSSLEWVSINETLMGTFGTPFQSCPALSNVYYVGNKEEFNANIGFDAFSGMSSIKIHCSDGTITHTYS